MSIDMEQFYEVFFEESLEGLDIMEQSLLSISESETCDLEVINSIFRAAHSIKGGSGTFGFNDVANFTHVLETLLDEAREGKRQLSEECIELLLQSCDCLREMFSALQNKQSIDLHQSTQLIAGFNRILSGEEGSASTAQSMTAAHTPSTGSVSMTSKNTGSTSLETANDDNKHWQINFAPQPQILMTGNEPARLFRELSTLGSLTTMAKVEEIPDFANLTVDECFMSWSLELSNSKASKEDILEVFDWVIDECTLEISLLGGKDPAPESEVVDVPALAALPDNEVSAPDASTPLEPQASRLRQIKAPALIHRRLQLEWVSIKSIA